MESSAENVPILICISDSRRRDLPQCNGRSSAVDEMETGRVSVTSRNSTFLSAAARFNQKRIFLSSDVAPANGPIHSNYPLTTVFLFGGFRNGWHNRIPNDHALLKMEANIV